MINLKEIRKTCGYSQQELAKKLGIPQQQYSRYETNTNKIFLETFLKILDACNAEFKITFKQKPNKEKY